MYLLSNDSTSSSEPVTPDQSHESIHHLNSKIPPFVIFLFSYFLFLFQLNL